jgi:uncharacterized membrane protein
MSDPEFNETPTTARPLKYTRSTPVRPMIWMTGVLVWATVIGFLFHVPLWAGIFLCSVTGLSFLLYLVSYIYLLATDREALRRERYSVKELEGQQFMKLKDAGKDPARGYQLQGSLATQPLSDEAAIDERGRAARSQLAASDEV